jgi:hypothetical protein
LRPDYFRECIRGIRANLPECPVVVACDDDTTLPLPHTLFVRLPFDSGLTAKRNAAVKDSRTKYSLLGCDDFDFSTPAARTGVERMVETLEAHPDVDVVVGTYNGMKYEGTLEYVPGEYIRERRLEGLPYCLKPYPMWKIELGINYFLARTEVLREVPWDETIRPIGGEHGDWFLEMKLQRKNIVFVEGCHMTTQKASNNPEYFKYRGRSKQGHELFMKKRNVKVYYGYGS